ncbi:sensor histidine kinase [Sphaerisporangium siamense]|uniref:histidine kinase n=1 Tax=Sphaerisporangium siamense TaxID=795645 RepID=A0A7W7DFH9_9ACTN|nr:histidine kinase [Sphaerisporangium siamense]MBB4704388.1 signal transduction histidine kinase [Sphaerisporangium siamense]
MHNPPTRWPGIGLAGVPGFPPARLLAGVITVALLAAWLGDMDRYLSAAASAGSALYLVSGVVMAALALWILRSGTSPAATASGAALALLTAQGVSVGAWLAGTPHSSIGLTEAAVTAVVVPLVAYRCRPLLMVAVAGLALTALLSASLRDGRPMDTDNALLVLLLLTPGLYARWRAQQHAWHIERVRRSERAALARDLHDVVAHQVTGIVVQVQSLQHVAQRDPLALRAALVDIEEAGSNALTAMRLLVTALREGEKPRTGNLTPAQALRDLERPDGPHAAVRVTLEADPDRLSPETAAAVVRMAQEAVANADRHARAATRITVQVSVGDGQVRLQVSDDGQGAAGGFTGGGYGLVGMAERAGLLGGSFHAGPGPDGTGWQVTARLPACAPPGDTKSTFLPTGGHAG